jgi:hypothetical protein
MDKRPSVLPLPGNSTKEQNFYDQQEQPAPGTEWPGAFDLDVRQDTNGAPTKPDPSPFKITGGR